MPSQYLLIVLVSLTITESEANQNNNGWLQVEKGIELRRHHHKYHLLLDHCCFCKIQTSILKVHLKIEGLLKETLPQVELKDHLLYTESNSKEEIFFRFTSKYRLEAVKS